MKKTVQWKVEHDSEEMKKKRAKLVYSGMSLQVVPVFSLVQEMFEVQVRIVSNPFSPACLGVDW